MIALLVALGALFALGGVRMRVRLRALAVLPPSAEPASADHRFITAPGVVLAESTRRAASAFARAEKLDVLDLVPGDLPAIRALLLAQVVDPATYRHQRLKEGRTAGHALLVSDEVARRAGLDVPADEVAFARLAALLKPYASTTSDVAVAPDERAAVEDLGRRYAVLRAVFGPSALVAMVFQLAVLSIVAAGLWLEPIVATVVLALWHVQTLVALVGSPIKSRDLAVTALLRGPVELWMWVRTATGRWRPAQADPVEARRPEYARLLASGGFFEPRSTACAMCGGTDLAVHLRTTDLLQYKPGSFTLERCAGCGHIFQNPRLSIAGLDFYYKDFYDGLGERQMAFLFGANSRAYVARAQMVKASVGSPARWLDVGAGHGHFCESARDVLPATTFDGLDLSESIDEAQRRGWVDRAWRGLFPDLAPAMAGAYDAVSMSHYLEHTLDPRSEIAAAHTTLAPGGSFLVEVPDPEFALGALLGRYWIPWFQPQHLHLLSAGNLERLLREGGFEPVAWDRGQAHQAVDFASAVLLFVGRLAPKESPWLARRPLAGARRTILWTLAAPLLFAGWLADRVADPFIRRSRRSNTYRVVARRL